MNADHRIGWSERVGWWWLWRNALISGPAKGDGLERTHRKTEAAIEARSSRADRSRDIGRCDIVFPR